MRAFVALQIPPPTRDTIVQLITSLRPKLPGVRWLAPETIHLTLRFLGDASEDALACLQPRLAIAAAACSNRDVRIGGLGMFPERGAPRVLWLGVEMSRELCDLQQRVESAAVACGFGSEDKPFRSHVTLGRWRERVRRPVVPELDTGPVRLEWLVLFKSELRSPGAIHTPLAKYRLGGD